MTQALEAMDPLDREIVALRHFEELTSSETARVLGIEERAASKRYLRALERLRRLLKGDSRGADTARSPAAAPVPAAAAGADIGLGRGRPHGSHPRGGFRLHRRGPPRTAAPGRFCTRPRRLTCPPRPIYLPVFLSIPSSHEDLRPCARPRAVSF